MSKETKLMLVADVFLLKFLVIIQLKFPEVDIIFTRYSFFFFYFLFFQMIVLSLRVFFFSVVSTAFKVFEASKNVL